MLCQICEKNEVAAENQACCAICHFTGIQFESFLMDDLRSNVLTKIRDLPQVTDAVVWHNGMSMFQLAVMLTDGRLIVPGVALLMDNEMEIVPAVPGVGVPWGVRIIDPVGESASELAGLYDDEGLVEVIQRIADNQLKDEDVPGLVI